MKDPQQGEVLYCNSSPTLIPGTNPILFTCFLIFSSIACVLMPIIAVPSDKYPPRHACWKHLKKMQDLKHFLTRSSIIWWSEFLNASACLKQVPFGLGAATTWSSMLGILTTYPNTSRKAFSIKILSNYMFSWNSSST